MAESFEIFLWRIRVSASRGTADSILVLGAGPKAMALAAKRDVLCALGWKCPELVVIEKELVVAPSWGGDHGFTDGGQELGTPPEKDVGFPYTSSRAWDAPVDREMLRYSWMAFKVDEAPGLYRDWVDQGKRHPPHGTWARYLRWVAEKSGVTLLLGRRVKAIAAAGDRWKLECEADDGGEDEVVGGGLVITGPGEPKRFEVQPSGHEHVMDGRSFWSRADVEFSPANPRLPRSVAVIGGGETAASVVVKLLDVVPQQTLITVINRHGTIFSRGEGFHENARFSDPAGWKLLPPDVRDEFVRRTDRGVFSIAAQERLSRALNVSPRMMNVAGIEVDSDSGLPLVVADDGSALRFDYVVVATGFEPLWFRCLCDERLKTALGPVEEIREDIQPDLSLRWTGPRLHLPMLAGFAQGPGFPNLSCLGTLSDRILSPYVEAGPGT